MGLNYTYLLYFERPHIWDALQGVVDMAEKHHPPTLIHFPDHDLDIPLDAMSSQVKEYQFDAPVMDFATSLVFEEDKYILEYLRDDDLDKLLRSPPDTYQSRQFAIGYIYLTIYQHNPDHDLRDYVFFEFDTPGSTMSILFMESPSIRTAFIRLLEKHHGVCGVFNLDSMGGELFWFKGQYYEKEIPDAFITPIEIEKMLK